MNMSTFKRGAAKKKKKKKLRKTRSRTLQYIPRAHIICGVCIINGRRLPYAAANSI